MKFLILKTTNPYINLATEEYFLTQSNEDIFMLWQNEPTIVIGKNQNAFAEINMDFVKQNNIHIARRISGGGAVYHDLGNVNYTFISKREKSEINFEHFTKPILDSLQNVGISAKLSGRNDLILDNKKFSGNAQHVIGSRVLHHGTLLFDTNLDVLTLALNVDSEKIKSKAIQSTRSRVTNLKPYFPIGTDAGDFIKMISQYVLSRFNAELIEAPICEEIDKLATRNASDEWLFPKSAYISGYTVTKKKRYNFGIVSIEINMSNEQIVEAKISGDFFGIKDVAVIESLLKNTSLENLYNTLQGVDINEYIFGMNNEEFIKLIKD
ncbi:MAG: lipoate--protein ligase [Ruminococcaceae bacterium]|nr:lipoate--protein ligase [Oscillospiraceae bacterium]